MGDMHFREENLERLREGVQPVNELPTQPATPQYIAPQQLTPEGPVHGGYIVTYGSAAAQTSSGDVTAYQWPDLLRTAKTEDLAAALLERFGVNRNLEHMTNTPKRFVRMMQELTLSEPFHFTTFEAVSDEMIVLTPIPFYTLCAHHVIPFFGQAHIGYVPDKKLAGLSKFGRLVKNIAKGMWVQELLTVAIADTLEEKLEPKGVAVVLRGEHMCMSMRGVAMPGVVTQTAAMRGVFADHSRTAKAEFLEAIRGNR